jgi:hypothetical protein
MKRLVLFPLVIAGVMMAGCEVTVTHPVHVHEPALPCYDGVWYGVTAQGYELSFTVEHDVITDIWFDYEIPCGLYKRSSKTSAMKSAHLVEGWPVDLVTGEFFVCFDDAEGYTHEVSGYFGNEWYSDGELSVYSPYCRRTLTVSWDAEREY